MTATDAPPSYSTSEASTYITTRRPPADVARPDNTVAYRLDLAETATYPAALRFPKPEHVWMSRDVDHADWRVFVAHLLPKQQAEHGEDKEARRDRIVSVVSEWNKDFFTPRGLKVLPLFGDAGDKVADGEVAATGSSSSGNASRGFGFKVGKNSLIGLSLPPNSSGFGLRLGGVLLGVRTGDGME